MGLGTTIERSLATLMGLLKSEIGHYCDLETVETDSSTGALIAKDGSMVSILRYEGHKSMMGQEEFVDALEGLTASAQTYLGNKGHQIQVVFDRDEDPTPEMNHRLRASYETAQRLELDVADLLDETKAVLVTKVNAESVFFVLWTRPSLLAPIEASMYAQENRQVLPRVPGMRDAQNPLRSIRFLTDRHNSFVEKFAQDIRNMKGSIRILDMRAALREVRASLFHDVTPIGWTPTVLGDAVYARWPKEPVGKDVSAAMPQPLARQLMPLDANNGAKGGAAGVSDTRAVRIGSRLYAPCFVSQFPQNPIIFDSLFRDLNKATTQTRFGQKPMPWRISFMIEGDGLSGVALKKIFAGVLGLTSESNRNLVKSANALGHYKASGHAVIKMQISAMTWVEYGDEKELMLRRSKLVRAITAWGNANVNEETGDPTQGAVNCGVGFNYGSIAPATAVPLEDALNILPLARPASPFTGGHVLFRTLDGKLMPYEMFSAEQRTWITVVFAGPGSGKSVLVNRLNTEMCWQGGLTALPFIGVIDIGVSSSGFIRLIQDALPEDKKHLCMYTRLQNTKDYTINPFDTMLGCRMPLAREREYMATFLSMLVTSPEGNDDAVTIRAFCGLIVDAMFKNLSDDNERAAPRVYTHGGDEIVTEVVERHGIEFNTRTSWWSIIDRLFALGEIHAAYRAQRFASPTLTDAVRAASDPGVVGNFKEFLAGGMALPEKFKLMVQTAISEYPIFASMTVFDVGEARLMAIDLNDVVTTGGAAAKRKAALMYMTARNLFMKKIAITEEDLQYVPRKYQAYHNLRFNDVKEIQKRLVYDEYHKTGGDPLLTEQAMADGREGRKWGLEIMISSQLPEDFKDIAKLATTVFIADAGTVQTRATIRDTFGLSPAQLHALVNNCHGPTAEGATVLAKFSTGESELCQLLTSTMGPMMLWALATGQEDRVLRDHLYKRLQPREARKALAWRFPKGSARAYIMKLRAEGTSENEAGFIDPDQETSVIAKVAKQLAIDWAEYKERNVVAA